MNHSADTIENGLLSFLQASVLAEGVEVDVDTSLQDVGIDSFSLMELVLYIERKFDIIIPEGQLTPDNLGSIRKLAACAAAAAKTVES